MIGKTISHYKITGKLGEGGMGVVYKAEDQQLQRTVALKFLPSRLLRNNTEGARFLQEARAAAALDHPNICTVFEISTVDEQTFIAMACVEGENLQDRVSAGPQPLDDALTITLQLSNALHEAHAKGVVHRDLKPGNVMISDKGHAILMDFGLAKLGGQTRITQAGTTLGTAAYMSPEQAKGQDVDHRSDIWSLGVMLFEMIAGRQPFTGDHPTAVMYAIANTPHPPLTTLRTDVPIELERIVGKMLAKDPNERYQTIDDVRVDLKAVRRDIRGETSTMTPPQSHSVAGTTPSGTMVIKQKRPVWVLPILGIFALAVVVMAFLSLRGGDDAGTAQSPATITKSLDNSLAVLPLKNFSGEEQNEFFVDGMTEELITQLASIRALKVISRTSIMRYKDSDRPLTEIASDLGVGKILEGSVLWAGDRVRISVQLIDGTNDAHLWANSYESDLSDVLGLQRRVAREVAAEIELELTPQEQAQLAKAPVVDREAHELYLQGRYHWNRRTVESLRKSIEYFEAALQRDPNYAMAYAGLAEAHIVLRSWDWTTPAAEGYSKAKEYALKALEIDPTLAGPHAVLGGVAGEYEWRWDEALRHFRRAIELNPNYTSAHQWYAELLTVLGFYDEAVREITIALEADPLALVLYGVAVWVHSANLDKEKTLAYYNKALELDPGFSAIHNAMAGSHMRFGEWKGYAESWTRYLEMTATSEQDRVEAKKLRALVGDDIQPWVRELLRRHKRQRRETYVFPSLIALDYAMLGEADSAIVWLEEGFDEPTVLMAASATDPRFDRVRSDDRFQAIIRRMGLEDAQQRYLEYRNKRSS